MPACILPEVEKRRKMVAPSFLEIRCSWNASKSIILLKSIIFRDVTVFVYISFILYYIKALKYDFLIVLYIINAKINLKSTHIKLTLTSVSSFPTFSGLNTTARSCWDQNSFIKRLRTRVHKICICNNPVIILSILRTSL